MHETFIDLDELIIRCRDKLSQKFIQEAVACYRAGAFRSCIVSTWNAVVFDFLHKLRELELFGDKNAHLLLQEFENLRSAEDFKKLWKFESDIPEKAEKVFELISPVEKLDIERLLEDRNRCAHPSMTSLEEPFEATAELARYHLRSAITHLLQRPPVQGRAARERIFQDIKSENFPVDPELAIDHFQESPLARARFTLIQDVVIGLTKSLLIENFPEAERKRQFSALIAISRMYAQKTGKILNEKLSEIILSRVDDENWDKVIIYLAKITAWESLSKPCQFKAKSFVEKLEIYKDKNIYVTNQDRFLPDTNILIKAAHIDFLRESVIQKFDTIPVGDILSLNETCGDNLFQTKIILPNLKKLAPEANLIQLFSIISKTSLASDETILSCIKDKAKSSSLKILAEIMSNYDYEIWQDFIENILEDKIINADCIELLSAKSKYNSSVKSKPEIIEMFDVQINERVLEVPFDDLLEYSMYFSEIDKDKLILTFQNHLSKIVDIDELLFAKSEYKNNSFRSTVPEIIELFDSYIAEKLKDIEINTLLNYPVDDRRGIPEKLLIPILKKNIQTIVSTFAKSSTYNSAAKNIKLLEMIAEELDRYQWDFILKAFFDNNQIYDSFYCLEVFPKLFGKNVELNNQSVPPYWLPFREKLNKLIPCKNTTISINNLKQLIDSHLTPDKKNQQNTE